MCSLPKIRIRTRNKHKIRLNGIVYMSRWTINIKIEIDLKKIRHNLLSIKEETDAKIMLMLKANAYGHGIKEVAQYVEDIVDAFGVETLDEALALKGIGIKKDILVLACAPEEVDLAVQNDFIIGVYNKEIVQRILCLSGRGEHARVHLKVDSGMHRLGLDEGLEDIVGEFKRSNIDVQGVYSHLRDNSLAQKEKFDALAKIVTRFYPSAIKHLASSHSLANTMLQYDMVRVGISAYISAMKAQSTVLDARFVPKGEKIGYGNFSLDKDSNIAVIFGGYADGILRENPPSVYINGKKCKPIGYACMDVFIVDTGDYLAKPYESAVLFDNDTIDEYVLAHNTINYCAMTMLHGRVKRCYNA